MIFLSIVGVYVGVHMHNCTIVKLCNFDIGESLILERAASEFHIGEIGIYVLYQLYNYFWVRFKIICITISTSLILGDHDSEIGLKTTNQKL